jgi:protein-ribulosamine 3-kinase
LRLGEVADGCDAVDEFGQWRPACNKFGDEYIQAYKKFAEVSEPKEDFEGRLDLYRL